MRTYELLRVFSRNEKDQLNTVIENQRRDGVKKIYKYIRKTPENKFNKEKACQEVFNEPYSKQLDNRLRQELYALNDTIKEQLIQIGYKAQRKIWTQLDDLFYARALSDKKAYDLALKDLPEMIERGDREFTPFLNAELLKSYSESHMSQPFSEERHAERLEIWKHIWREYRRCLLYGKRVVEMHNTILQRRFLYSTDVEQFPKALESDTAIESIGLKELVDDPMNDYLMTERAFYQGSVEDQMETYEDLLLRLHELKTTTLDKVKIEANILNWLGVGSLHLNSYQLALENIEKLITHLLSNGRTPTVKHITNYIVFLTIERHPEKLLQVYSQFERLLSSSQKLPYVHLCVMVAHIQMDDYLKARDFMDTSGRTEPYIYTENRLFEIAILILEGAHEVAYNLVKNLMRAIRGKTPEITVQNAHKTICTLFLQLTKVYLLPSAQQEQAFKSLFDLVRQKNEENLFYKRSILSFFWIQDHLREN